MQIVRAIMEDEYCTHTKYVALQPSTNRHSSSNEIEQEQISMLSQYTNRILNRIENTFNGTFA